MTSFTSIAVTIFLVALALYIKPLRKTIGLIFVILGAVICLTYIGMIIGIPLIFIGGLMLFI